MTGPLHGVKVVELGVWVAGPAAAGILADWGADVVKIEPRTGDPARTFGRMLGLDVDVSPPFELDNRSKRSVVLDLEEPDDRDAALGLIDDADVFVTNIRPSALRRLGLDYAALAARRPRLVYGLITGYGSAGPDADRAAYDVAAFWARGGRCSPRRAVTRRSSAVGWATTRPGSRWPAASARRCSPGRPPAPVNWSAPRSTARASTPSAST